MIRIAKIVKKVNSFEDTLKIFQMNFDFPKKTLELKEKLKKGKILDDLLPEAFALSKRGF